MKIQNRYNEALETLIEGEPIELAKNIIIFTHGFGTDLHEKGIFDEIVIGLTQNKSEICTIRFSWPGYGKSEGTQSRTTATKVSDCLEDILDFVFKHKAPGANVKLLAYSMGNMIQTDAITRKPYKIPTVINAEPNRFYSRSEFKKAWTTRPGTHTDKNGNTHIPRSDGTISILSEDFFKDIDAFADRYPSSLKQAVADFNSILVHLDNGNTPNYRGFDDVQFSNRYELTGDHTLSDKKERQIFVRTVINILLEG